MDACAYCGEELQNKRGKRCLCCDDNGNWFCSMECRNLYEGYPVKKPVTVAMKNKAYAEAKGRRYSWNTKK